MELLNNPLIVMHSSIMQDRQKVDSYPELLVLLWRLLECNSSFLVRIHECRSSHELLNTLHLKQVEFWMVLRTSYKASMLCFLDIRAFSRHFKSSPNGRKVLTKYTGIGFTLSCWVQPDIMVVLHWIDISPWSLREADAPTELGCRAGFSCT